MQKFNNYYVNRLMAMVVNLKKTPLIDFLYANPPNKLKCTLISYHFSLSPISNPLSCRCRCSLRSKQTYHSPVLATSSLPAFPRYWPLCCDASAYPAGSSPTPAMNWDLSWLYMSPVRLGALGTCAEICQLCIRAGDLHVSCGMGVLPGSIVWLVACR